MPISYSHLLLYGFLTYAANFMLWALLGAYGMNYGSGAQAASYIVTFLAVFLAAWASRPGSMQSALVCGVVWAVMHIVLDLVYIVPAAGFLALLTPFPWVSYAIVLLTPSAVVIFSKKQSAVTLSPKKATSTSAQKHLDMQH